MRKSSIESPAKQEKLLREIRILKSLQHPNIVKLYEVIETEHYIGMVMEYASGKNFSAFRLSRVVFLIILFMEGGELFEHILARRYLKEKEAAFFFAQLIKGVDYLHKSQIIHRDLKLENLLLDSKKNIIITDFGFANTSSLKTGPESLLSTSCGSPCYAAPELVINDGYVGEVADVWSCGVILYAMLCGYLPFEDDPENPNGENINLLYKYILETKLEIPSYVPPLAQSLIRSILVTDPAKRATIAEIKSHKWLRPYAYLFQEDSPNASAQLSIVIPDNAEASQDKMTAPISGGTPVTALPISSAIVSPVTPSMAIGSPTSVFSRDESESRPFSASAQNAPSPEAPAVQTKEPDETRRSSAAADFLKSIVENASNITSFVETAASKSIAAANNDRLTVKPQSSSNSRDAASNSSFNTDAAVVSSNTRADIDASIGKASTENAGSARKKVMFSETVHVENKRYKSLDISRSAIMESPEEDNDDNSSQDQHTEELEAATRAKRATRQQKTQSVTLTSSSSNSGSYYSAVSSLNGVSPKMYPKLKQHTGPIDQRALSSKDPEDLINQIKESLEEMGMHTSDVAGEDFKILVTCPAKNTLDSTQQYASTTDTTTEAEKQRVGSKIANIITSFPMSVVRKFQYLSLFGPQYNKGFDGRSHTLDGSPSVLPSNYKPASTEIRFHVTIHRIKNLPGLYVVDYKRLRGNIWAFKRLYHESVLNLILS